MSFPYFRDADAEDIDEILKRLEQIRENPRLPLIETKCSCKCNSRKTSNDHTLYLSDEEESSSDESSSSDTENGKGIEMF